MPAGYFDTPNVRTFEAYPHLFHLELKSKFPFAVINTIVTAIGGESSPSGLERISQVMAHTPDIVVIDYGINDLTLPSIEMEKAWIGMARAVLAAGAIPVFVTPTWDEQEPLRMQVGRSGLSAVSAQIKNVGSSMNVLVADVYEEWTRAVEGGVEPSSLLSFSNHPNLAGHMVICKTLINALPWPSSLTKLAP